MKNQFHFSLLLVFLFGLSLWEVGCLSGKSEKAVEAPTPQTEETSNPPSVAELDLSLAKSTYANNEPIPIEMTIGVGKFDLLVPYVTVEGKGAFTKLTVKNATGELIKPRYPITMASHPKMLIRKGKETRCIPGADLKALMKKKVVLEDLQAHYKLGPGNYTLQVLMNLKVYRESLPDQSLQILELEREIGRIQKNAKIPTGEKQEVVGILRKEIEFIRSNEKEASDKIYLPLDSLRGSADIESDVVTLTIQ